ncbi:MAG: aminotransferase class V-fold PLP-dependent enzyme [Phascolarctobacterium sp.]|nr:aminotransferase class V-fold PLP-dependent enzyme [Candidatus Phascolarctobacterium caballi]
MADKKVERNSLNVDTTTDYQHHIIKERYDKQADDIIAVMKTFMGYPVNENSGLSSFYKWYADSGLLDYSMNNAGDPFGPSHLHIDTLELEKEIITHFGKFFDFPEDNLWGLMGTGGTDGNHHGIYFGKKILLAKTGKWPVAYVSKEAHYSNRRLADLQGMRVKLIECDKMGRMDPKALDKALEPEYPVLIVYALGTTFKGAIDDIQILDKVIADKGIKDVYRHVDAALFGGYLPFTNLKHLISQKKLHYDSIAFSGHKFFGIDEPCGVFLCTKDTYDAQKADKIPYLEASMPMISCSRNALTPMKLYWLLQTRGWYAYAREIMVCLENAKFLYNELCKMQWPAWLGYASNTVFFKKPSDELIHKYTLATEYDERLGGDLAHIIVMQHVKQPLLEQFVEELQKEIDAGK